MTVKEYLEKTYKNNDYNVRPRITCNDGYSISVQGGTSSHYCKPRELCHDYYSVELGYPSESDELINNFAEGAEGCRDFTNTVYPYVPIVIVEQLIAKHGGIK